MRNKLRLALLPLLLAACAPGAPEDPSGAGGDAPVMTDEQYRDQAVEGMHDALLADVVTMSDAVRALQAAAPVPEDRGWDAEPDAGAIASMRASWVRARTAYEHVEGALAPLFPPIDNSIDARYDDFLTQLEAQGGDPDLFDGRGVTGMHAVERILYADVTPAGVVAFERSLPGYVKAAFPSTAAEAARMRDELCQKLVTDVDRLRAEWTPANIDVAIAFQGLISLVTEQREKVQKAASNEEESRYSQRTMADLRDNLHGANTVYARFRPWILSKPEGPAHDRRIQEGLAALHDAYAEVEGDAIPAPPASWSAEAPSPTDLRSPFGRLYTAVRAAVDPAKPGSVVAELVDVASELGFPTFVVAR